MKRWMIAAAALLLAALLAGCAETRDVLRTGTTEGVTAQIVPADTGLPEPVALSGKKPMVKHFHQQPQLVDILRHHAPEGVAAGDPCPICGAGAVVRKEQQPHEWRADRTTDCPIDPRVRDWVVRRSVTEVYTCDRVACDFGYEIVLIYETVNCQSEAYVPAGS